MAYTLDDFFRVQTEVSISGRTITVRSLGDAEIQACRRARQMASLTRRKELREDELGEREGWERDLGNQDKDSLLAMIRDYQYVDIEDRMRAQRPFEPVIVPDEATPEEEMDALEQRAAARQEYELDIRKKAEEATEAALAQLAQKPPQELHEQAIKFTSKTQEFIAGQVAFNRHVLYHACSEGGKPLFTCAEEVGKFPARLLNKLMTTYMEVQGVDIETLEDFFGMASSSAGART